MIPLSLILKWFIGPAGKWLLVAAAIGFAVWWIDDSGYARGRDARDAVAREQMAKMEQRMAERLRQNEGLTEDEVDCALRRIRNPKAECGK